MRFGRCFVALICSAGAASASDAEFDPSTVDLGSLIECREDARTYNSFALWLAGEPAAAEALGWQEVASDNPFLKEYRLPAAIGVFGHDSDRIAFTASGPMAVFDAVAPDELAKKLGITPEIATAGKFLGEKSRPRGEGGGSRDGLRDARRSQRVHSRFSPRQDAGRVLLQDRSAVNRDRSHWLMAHPSLAAPIAMARRRGNIELTTRRFPRQ